MSSLTRKDPKPRLQITRLLYPGHCGVVQLPAYAKPAEI
eukprot:CAMPEP_0176463954 /NCGR_PEP_ID=MMETSP0127-20121128/36212_1 /TAXON_ID=938130 /ORGANISM="Platyophrya macrostoma, Strain WH" /LENGTH=38 /DNA_ID= /DNA_START= /DNA_END= /DNA_ORIENTATION=